MYTVVDVEYSVSYSFGTRTFCCSGSISNTSFQSILVKQSAIYAYTYMHKL